jgi:hypothetical protein
MDMVANHQTLAVLALERGDYLGAAQHYRAAANCYPLPEQEEACRKLAEQEVALQKAQEANGMVLVEK